MAINSSISQPTLPRNETKATRNRIADPFAQPERRMNDYGSQEVVPVKQSTMDDVRIGRTSFNSTGNDDTVIRPGDGAQPFAATYDAKQGNPVRYEPTDRSSATVGPVYPGS